MGFLALGTPLDWPEAKKESDHVRKWGIEQLLSVWRKARGKERDAMLWGDEVEYLLLSLDVDHNRARLSLCQEEILAAISNARSFISAQAPGFDASHGKSSEYNMNAPIFHQEFGRFMLEATPGKPWAIGFKDLLDVEMNMTLRRKLALEYMKPTDRPITLTTFPRLGCPDQTVPKATFSGPVLRSQFVPDEVVNQHIRFPTLAANIRSRRGRKVQINVPVFRDVNTPWPFKDPTIDYDLHKWPEDDDVRQGACLENHIYMDAMVFGMGSCCLQITFQAKNIEEGRKLYDQLSPLAPILLALTAATPIYKGFLADTDVRWNQISAAVDDRTPEELGEAPLKNYRWRIPKSRYASNSTYISQDPRLRPEYLDPDLIVDNEIKDQLTSGGMDDLLATHFAHLFIRDPLVIFAEGLKRLDIDRADHFENLQSTNWQHVRFKPPPPASDMGWRVEFRPMEIQPTDFENAAFAIFIVLVTRVILSFDLNFYIPITRVDQNMQTAHKRDAVLEERFWFRKNLFPKFSKQSTTSNHANSTGRTSDAASKDELPGDKASRAQLWSTRPVEDEYRLMTIAEIVNGTRQTATTSPSPNQDVETGHGPIEDSNGIFPGIIPLVETYLSSVNIDIEARCALERYLDLIRRRADGRQETPAKWMRSFVRGHSAYKGNSVVSDEVQWDLIQEVLRRA